MQKMHEFFPEVNESTFYAILRRLHNNGKTEVIIKENANGPTRKYYRIKKDGEELLSKNIDEWNELIDIIKKIGI